MSTQLTLTVFGFEFHLYICLMSSGCESHFTVRSAQIWTFIFDQCCLPKLSHYNEFGWESLLHLELHFSSLPPYYCALL